MLIYLLSLILLSICNLEEVNLKFYQLTKDNSEKEYNLLKEIL